jgi:hypothetical protein
MVRQYAAGSMTDRTDLRLVWRRNWLICLGQFADKNLQQRTWLDPKNRNPHWSYIEFMCSYFDDTLRSHSYDWAIAEGLVTKQEAAAVAPLHELLVRHEAPGGDDYDNDRILNDPAWHEIVEAANRSIRDLTPLLEDPHEKTALNISDASV